MKKMFALALFSAGFQCLAEIFLPDPTIFKDGEVFYLTGTHGASPGARSGGSVKIFPMYKSKNLSEWSAAGADGGEMFALSGGNCLGFSQFWAPQIFRKSGKYYFAYTACAEESKDILKSLRVAIASADKIEGGFSNAFILPSAVPEIDPFVFIDDDGKAYIYLVHWARGGGIWAQRLSDDLKTRIGEMKSCVRATEDWERTPLSAEFAKLNAAAKRENPDISPWLLYRASGVTAEGPTLVKRAGKYALFYSANDYRSPDYCVCVAVADSPMGDFKKLQKPVITRRNTGFNGTGHGDVFFDKTGGMWYVFHVHNSNAKIEPRRAAIVKLVETVAPDGYPRYRIDPSTLRLL